MNATYSDPLGGEDDTPCNTGALLQILLREEACLACGISDNDAPFLRRLYVGLEVTPDAISNHRKGESFLIKDVAMLGG